MALCIPEKIESRIYPVLRARHDEQNVQRRQRRYSRTQVWATQFNGESNNNKKKNQNKPGAIQNKIIGRATSRAAVNRKFCRNVYNFPFIRSFFASVNIHFLNFNRSRRFHSLLRDQSASRAFRSRSRLMASILRLPYFRLQCCTTFV